MASVVGTETEEGTKQNYLIEFSCVRKMEIIESPTFYGRVSITTQCGAGLILITTKINDLLLQFWIFKTSQGGSCDNLWTLSKFCFSENF